MIFYLKTQSFLLRALSHHPFGWPAAAPSTSVVDRQKHLFISSIFNRTKNKLSLSSLSLKSSVEKILIFQACLQQFLQNFLIEFSTGSSNEILLCSLASFALKQQQQKILKVTLHTNKLISKSPLFVSYAKMYFCTYKELKC